MEAKQGQLRLIASPDGRDGSVVIHQDALLFASILDQNDAVNYELQSGRTAYLHLIRGALEVNGQKLTTGDALKIKDIAALDIRQASNAEFLLFDLPY